ncbi:MAG: ROK family protein [Candidatus Planktophila sp.]
MKYVVAVDIGGTEIKSALVNDAFDIISTASTATPKPDPDGQLTLALIEKIVHEYSLQHEVSAVGLGVLGVFDDALGICRWSGNLGWKNFPIRDQLQARLGIPVAAGHDIRTAGVAEHRDGAATGYKNSVFIAIGTGIAAALVIDGQIRYSDGFAGEIGHINVNGDFDCVCGKKGCLEAASSALSISTAYKNRTGNAKSTEEIASLVTSGDSIAADIWNTAALALARGCEYVITMLAPEAIIFGGGLARSGELLLQPIREYLEGSLTFQRMPELKVARFGAKAGAVGCAMLAFDLVQQKN